MGYDVQILRDPSDWDKDPITEEQWQKYIDLDPDLRRPEVGKPYYSERLALLPPAPGDPEGWPWLSWVTGSIYAKYPQDNTLRKMIVIAKYFEAQVVGENDEIFLMDEKGNLFTSQEGQTEAFSTDCEEQSWTPPPQSLKEGNLSTSHHGQTGASSTESKDLGCTPSPQFLKQKRKGCIIVASTVLALLFAGYIAIPLMVRRYEKRQKASEVQPNKTLRNP